MSSRFEFLGSMTIGQYIPRKSWFHQRDPRARVLSFLFLFIAVILTPGFKGLAAGFIVIILIYILAELPFKSTWVGITRALPFILIIGVLQIIFFSPLETDRLIFNVFGLPITQSAVTGAGIMVLRFIALISHLNAVTMSLSTSQISAAQFHLLKPFEKLGFPINDLTLVVQITLRYLPLVAQIAEKTAKAQASRGGDWEQTGFNPIRQAKRIIPLIVPIIVTSLKRAETMAVAMESRGFNAAHKRSSFYTLKFTRWDAVLVIGALLISTLLLLFGWMIV
jgi:energy-coupling factor transport system permease protein